MLETAKDLAKDPKWRTRIIEKPEVWGLESVSGDALVDPARHEDTRECEG